MFHSLGQPNVRITPDRERARATASTPATSRRWSRRPSAARRSPRSTRARSASTSRCAGREPYRKDLSRPSARSLVADAGRARRSRSGSSPQIAQEEGPALIYREDGRRYAPVKFSVRGRDLASTIAEAQQQIAAQGEAALRHAPRVGGRDQRAERGDRARLTIIIPLTLLLIAFLVYSAVQELARHAHRAR